VVLNRVVRFDTLSHIAKRPVYVSLEILTGLVAGRELVTPCFSPLSVRVSNFDPEQTFSDVSWVGLWRGTLEFR